MRLRPTARPSVDSEMTALLLAEKCGSVNSDNDEDFVRTAQSIKLIKRFNKIDKLQPYHWKLYADTCNILWSKHCHPFSFHYSFYKCWPISIIFGTHYTGLICNITFIALPTSSIYCCCTTLQKKSVAKIITLPNKLHFFVAQTNKTSSLSTQPVCTQPKIL